MTVDCAVSGLHCGTGGGDLPDREVVLGLLLSSQILLNALVGGVLALQAGKTAKSPDTG